jgi:alkaline phosphatase
MKNKGKRHNCTLILVLILLIVPATLLASGSKIDQSTGQPVTVIDEPAKYVFVFIGDGMGLPQINAAERYMAALEGEKTGSKMLTMSTFPAQGITTTYAADRFITGSAAAATAIATGYKTAIGVISMDPTKTMNYKTVAEMAKEKGMRVGIVSSVSIDHATPAAFYAHQPSRSMYYEISVDLANSGFDYFGGGGLKRPSGKNKDKPSSIDMARRNGYTVVSNRYDFMALKPGVGKVIAYNAVLDKDKALPYELDRDTGDISLAEYTAKGIELLNNQQGFFLMVEGGKIDWACHANDATSSILDTFAFDEAIEEAVEFYNAHPDETLIIVTGDHECGGMTLGFAGTEYATSFALLEKQKKSATDFFASTLLAEYKETHTLSNADIMDLQDEIEEYFGLVWLTEPERKALEARAEAGDYAAEMKLALAISDFELKMIEDAFIRTMGGKIEGSDDQETYLLYGGYEPLAVTLSHILNQKAGIGWTSYKHTGVPVPTFAMGVGAGLFNGYYDNTDIGKKVMQVLMVGERVAMQ